MQENVNFNELTYETLLVAITSSNSSPYRYGSPFHMHNVCAQTTLFTDGTVQETIIHFENVICDIGIPLSMTPIFPTYKGVQGQHSLSLPATTRNDVLPWSVPVTITVTYIGVYQSLEYNELNFYGRVSGGEGCEM